MKNDHMWFGLCFRNWGTNYTNSQRICILFMSVLSIIFKGARKMYSNLIISTFLSFNSLSHLVGIMIKSILTLQVLFSTTIVQYEVCCWLVKWSVQLSKFFQLSGQGFPPPHNFYNSCLFKILGTTKMLLQIQENWNQQWNI